jgi:hypothetical protein
MLPWNFKAHKHPIAKIPWKYKKTQKGTRPKQKLSKFNTIDRISPNHKTDPFVENKRLIRFMDKSVSLVFLSWGYSKT